MKSEALQPIYLKNYQVPEFLIEKVDLNFDLTEEFTTVTSSLSVLRNPAAHHRSPNLQLDGDGLELEAVAINGVALVHAQYEETSHALTIFNVPDQFTLTIQTRIKPQENTALSGLYKSSGNFCTQCEAHGFRRITYFLDRPDVMARYTTTITADKKQYPILLSNGNLIESGQSNNGRHWVKWEDPFKKPCYLFALVAGDLEFIQDYFVTQSGRRITLQIYVEKGNQNKCAHAMQAIKKAMAWDEKNYGCEYDLDVYMIVAVSDFNMGAMENKGLNIFNTQYILASPETATDMDYIHVESVIAHEYFHNWTGNRITCRDWFQLSLKEGLTIFRDQCFTSDTTSKTVARIFEVDYLRASQFSEDAGPLAHSVRPESYVEINNFYTSTVYNKGAEVIRMLRTIVGDVAYRKGMDLYFSRHDGQAVTIEDFVKAHEDASGVDLTQFRLWYSQAGTPLLEVNDYYDGENKKYALKITQTCPATPGQTNKKPLHIPLEMGLIGPSGSELLRDTLHMREKEHTFVFQNISERPVPSLLRSFSAPVKLKFDYSNTDLSLLMKHDTDLFNRWDAGQRYVSNIIFQLIANIQQDKPLIIPSELIEIIQYQLKTCQEDKWLLAKMLSFPSERYLAEQMPIIDVDAIHTAREFVLSSVAKQLKNTFLELYEAHHNPSAIYEFNIAEVEKRYLKNCCLLYLMRSGDTTLHENLGMRQFRSALAHNMTDTIAALDAFTQVECAQRQTALAEFYQVWREDALVVDKWLALQAGSKLPGTLNRVKELVRHEAFDIKNPNKVYSLIGTFTNNPVYFHARSGAGYQFLAEMVLQLDALNPQIAARMIKPLTNWRRFDDARQKLMLDQLKLMAGNHKLSRDVDELVVKSL